MKKELIKVNSKYSDGKGNVRLVIGIGSQYISYNSQMDTDCLRYQTVSHKPGRGIEKNCTMSAFCSWSKKEIK